MRVQYLRSLTGDQSMEIVERSLPPCILHLLNSKIRTVCHIPGLLWKLIYGNLIIPLKIERIGALLIRKVLDEPLMLHVVFRSAQYNTDLGLHSVINLARFRLSVLFKFYY